MNFSFSAIFSFHQSNRLQKRKTGNRSMFPFKLNKYNGTVNIFSEVFYCTKPSIAWGRLKKNKFIIIFKVLYLIKPYRTKLSKAIAQPREKQWFLLKIKRLLCVERTGFVYNHLFVFLYVLVSNYQSTYSHFWQGLLCLMTA